MILLLIGIITFIVMAISIIGHDIDNEATYITGVIFLMLGVFALMVYIVVIVGYIGAGYKADIMNREYGTQYTQAEVFYASDVIATVRQLNRKRIEVNGDLSSGEEK